MRLRWPSSLQARLLWLLFGVVAAALVVQALFTYRTALDSADELFDFHMQQTAMSLRYGLPLTEAVPGERPATPDREDEFVIQVWSADGLRVFGSQDAPILPARAQLGFANVKLQRATYRMFSVASSTHVIQVAQDMAVRRQMARALALRTVAPVAVMTPILMLVILWLVKTSLAPLVRVRQQVATRQADDLSEISEARLPDEIQPLIHELNLLFARVRQAFAAQQSFVADAAHELRSPLAALKLQVQGLKRGDSDSVRQLAATRLAQGVDRATHLVEQLLVLARQQASAVSGVPAEPFSLAALVQLAVADAMPAATERDIDLGAIKLDQDRILGHPDALRILLRNLIDNAIKYSPPGSTVDLAVRRDGDELVLTVEDSGPGIDPDDQARVFDRFYRVPGSDAHGSGLGLAIVKAIAELHGGHLAIDRSPRLGGLRVSLGLKSPTLGES